MKKHRQERADRRTDRRTDKTETRRRADTRKQTATDACSCTCTERAVPRVSVGPWGGPLGAALAVRASRLPAADTQSPQAVVPAKGDAGEGGTARVGLGDGRDLVEERLGLLLLVRQLLRRQTPTGAH